MWADKNEMFVYEIDEKYVEQNKPANCNAENMKGIRQNLIFLLFNETKKRLSDIHREKIVFS